MNSYLSLLTKVKINPFFWLIIGIGIITGYFREVIMVFLIVFIHEMGHACMAHFFKWRIKKIELLPFGGVAEVDEHGNRPFKEEFFVIIAGPLQHLWLIGLSFLFLSFDFWTLQEHETFIKHNLTILLFNLLPVWPLDGGKLLFLLCSFAYPYRDAHKNALSFSFCILLIGMVASFFYFPFHLNLWIVISFLLISHYLEWRQRHYVFMRFLLERYYNDVNQRQMKALQVEKQTKVGDILKQFERGVCHEIVIQHNHKCQFVFKEQELLQAFFEKNKARNQVGDLLIKT
ncbi:M50 family metallopeptidase [Anaerobacillus sp. MEB173]|uniref:M50 family metallopeptidase n=1 Tax=Anaerobacillus sp. MEB173 TaxID=3383345 RepID=UPI003F8EEE94